MAEPPAGQPKPIEPPAGQPVSGGYHGPMTDEQKADVTRRLLEMFPDVDLADFWSRAVRSADGAPYPVPPPRPAPGPCRGRLRAPGADHPTTRDGREDP